MNKRILSEIRRLQQTKERLMIAIDGRCGAGKTTLARDLQKKLGCNVIHLDDFFLRVGQRTEARMKEAGGNVDYERFLTEVLQPLKAGRDFSYRPYQCKTGSFAEPVAVQLNPITLAEGAYACHPKFWDAYDLHIFLDITPEEQMRRIINRNGEQDAKVFKNIWIPLEENYFQAFSIKERCELTF